MKYRYFAVVFGIIVLFLFTFLLFQGGLTGYSVFNPMDKYNFENLPNSFQLFKGHEFGMDIDFDEGYTFSDDNELFDINSETGVIYFTPGNEGNYSIVIIALKDINDFRYKLINFEVINQ